MLMMLIIAPLRTLITTESALQLPLDIGQLALGLVLLSLVLHRSLMHLQWRDYRQQPVVLAISMFLLVILLNAFWAASFTAWLSEFIKWLQILLMIVLVRELSRSMHWGWFIAGVLAAGTVNAIIGMYQYFGGSGALHLLVNERFFRAFGTFGQPNPFGGFMGMLIPLSLAVVAVSILLVFKGRSAALPQMTFVIILSGASLGLMSAGIIMSWSRGAWLGLLAALTMMTIAFPRKAWHGLVLGAMVVVIIAGLWVSGLLPNSIVQRIQSSADELFAIQDVRGVDIDPENYAVVERLAHWQAALNMARSSPFAGVGLGNYEVVYDNFRLINWLEPLGHAHNYYLNILAEMGLLGLLVYGKVWFILFMTAYQARRHPNPLSRAIAISILGTWTYFSVHSLFDNLYVNNAFLHLGILIGVLMVIHSEVQSTAGVSGQ
jgi:O-antigen ligase